MHHSEKTQMENFNLSYENTINLKEALENKGFYPENESWQVVERGNESCYPEKLNRTKPNTKKIKLFNNQMKRLKR